MTASVEQLALREAVARAICRSCGDAPDHIGDAGGNAYRWQDYLPCADAAITELEREVTHWKANHANEVKRSRILKERPDMPIERVRAYEQWGEDQERIKELERQLDEIERVGRMGAA